jgi:hypothetical protein
MKKKIFLPVAATMIAIAIFTGGAVMAQGPGPDQTGVVQSFASRVAVILGLNEADVQNAMDQARTEMQDEAMQSRLAALVEQGRLTQEQADEYSTWLKSRPEGIQGFGGRGLGLEFEGHGHRHGHGMKEGRFGAPDRIPDDAPPPQDGSSGGTGTSF